MTQTRRRRGLRRLSTPVASLRTIVVVAALSVVAAVCFWGRGYGSVLPIINTVSWIGSWTR